MLSRLRTIKNDRLYNLSHGKKVLLDNLGIVSKTPSLDDSLDNTFKWIKASFEAGGDGGSSAYYKLSTGWKGSYPETTGYLIPTMYEYAAYRENDEWKNLAKRAADWLLQIQAPEGGWQGLHIGTPCDLRIFNSGMILDGLIAAYRVENDKKYLDSAVRGLDWILSKQDDSGFFSENNVVGGGAFDTLVCAGLLMVAQCLPEEEKQAYFAKIRKALDAHLTLQTENYWFKNCSFRKDGTALLHHLGYTTDGFIISSDILGDDKYYQAAKKTARKLLSKFEVELELPAYTKSDWSTNKDLGNKATLCLTGYSQISIVFQKIAKTENDMRYLNAALKINDIVASIGNYKSSNKGLSYGLAGSYPINGGYQRNQMVNWAAKYHGEALLLTMDKCMSKAIQS